MRVNSVFKGFFNNRMAAGSGIAVVMLLCISVASASELKPSDRDLRAKQVNLMIRQIGHRLLLQSGDSTSRVLPVTETKEGTFLLTFENEFVFSHDSLMALSLGLLPKTQFPSGYTVTVHDCLKTGIVFGFQVSNIAQDMLPCRGRSELPGCYTIEFTFPDFYERIEPNKADIGWLTQETKSVKVYPQQARPKPEAFKTATADDGSAQRAEELKPVKADTRETNANPDELKAAISEDSLVNLIFSGTLVLFGVSLLIVRFGRILTPAALPNQNHEITKESTPEFAALGKFLFDVKGQCLLLGSEVIALTDKECKILELFNDNFNELIPRETLMQKVWINEGVITGRSLDMFVSKLRKKLSSDPALRITNVHGKGYKLEMSGIRIS